MLAYRLIKLILNSYYYFHWCSDWKCIVVVPHLILKNVSILTLRYPRRNLDRYQNFSVTLWKDSTQPDLFNNFQLVLASREDQVRVLRPRIISIILDDQFLLYLLSRSQLVKVWVLDAHQLHRQRASHRCVVETH